MRKLILAVLLLASVGTAHAADCSGSGTATLLTVANWQVSTSDPSQVELTYALDADKPLLTVQAHLYFRAGDATLADAAFDLQAETALPARGPGQLALAPEILRRLRQADPASVSVLACSSYAEYQDGSAAIFD